MDSSSDNPHMQAGMTKTSADGRRQFKLTRRVGLGGFGEVYLAEMSTSSGFTKTVALKLLRTDKEGEGDNARRMRDEARLLGLLRHRAIVQADDLITIDGRTAVIMEYIPGANLSDILERNRFPHPLPANLGLEVTAELADAMDAAWTRPSEVTGKSLKVLHRDIKPANVRITPDGQVKILDFGIARAEKMDRETSTRDYAVGSLPYMAPELLVGHGASPASDIYALGVTLLETLSRHRFGIAQDTAEGHDARITERMLDMDVPALEPKRNELIGLVRKMMAFDPEDRPSAKEVARFLRDLIHSLHLDSLQQWAREWIAEVHASDPDGVNDGGSRADLSGQIFFEDNISKADTWDGDTLSLTKDQIPVPSPSTSDNSWTWKTALILLTGLVMVLGYRLVQDNQTSDTEANLPPLAPAPPVLPEEGSPPPTNAGNLPDTEPELHKVQEPADQGHQEILPAPDLSPVESVKEPDKAAEEETPVVMAPAKFQSEPNRGVIFGIDGQESDGSREFRTPRKLELSTGSHELICDPQGQSFSANIVVPAEGGTWICNTTLGEVKGP